MNVWIKYAEEIMEPPMEPQPEAQAQQPQAQAPAPDPAAQQQNTEMVNRKMEHQNSLDEQELRHKEELHGVKIQIEGLKLQKAQNDPELAPAQPAPPPPAPQMQPGQAEGLQQSYQGRMSSPSQLAQMVLQKQGGIMFDSGAGKARKVLHQKYRDAGWSDEQAAGFVPHAAKKLWGQGGGPGYQDRVGAFKAPRFDAAPAPTGQPAQQPMDPRTQQIALAAAARR